MINSESRCLNMAKERSLVSVASVAILEVYV